jgi:hypothetical protein
MMGARSARARPAARRSLIVAAAVVIVVAGGVARGEASPGVAPLPKLSDSLKGQAKDDYESGRVLFENNDYAGALVKFQHAFDLSDDFRLLWNMGACEKNLRHYTRVLMLVEQFLREGGARISAAQRDEAMSVLRTVRPLIGEIDVSANETGASVYLDGALVGTTPLKEPVRADLGDRRIQVTKDGFKEQVAVTHVTGGARTSVAVKLERGVRGGRLLVATTAGAAIDLDGKPVGLGRWEGEVVPGTHALRIGATGMQTYHTELVVGDGESRTVDVTLQKASTGISPLWWIGGGVVAAGLGVGGYFLLRPKDTTAAPMDGTISPYTIPVRAPGH